MFWISEFHRVFCLYKREMIITTCSVSFSIIVCRYFSKWRIFLFSKNWKGCINPPPLTLWLWRLTLPPGKVVHPFFFFHENDRKGCKRDYLKGTNGLQKTYEIFPCLLHILFWFHVSNYGNFWNNERWKSCFKYFSIMKLFHLQKPLSKWR